MTGTKFTTPGTMHNVQMSLGWTRRSSFNQLRQTDTTLRDTFLTCLTPVYSATSIRQNIKDAAMRWMRFPVSGNGFLYEPGQEGSNLVVEVAFGMPYVDNCFCFWDSGEHKAVISF